MAASFGNRQGANVSGERQIHESWMPISKVAGSSESSRKRKHEARLVISASLQACMTVYALPFWGPRLDERFLTSPDLRGFFGPSEGRAVG